MFRTFLIRLFDFIQIGVVKVNINGDDDPNGQALWDVTTTFSEQSEKSFNLKISQCMSSTSSIYRKAR